MEAGSRPPKLRSLASQKPLPSLLVSRTKDLKYRVLGPSKEVFIGMPTVETLASWLSVASGGLSHNLKHTNRDEGVHQMHSKIPDPRLQGPYKYLQNWIGTLCTVLGT